MITADRGRLPKCQPGGAGGRQTNPGHKPARLGETHATLEFGLQGTVDVALQGGVMCVAQRLRKGR
jgi:hypothetical protein